MMVYLDNSATTPLCSGAKYAVAQAIEHFGNPSSLHAAGLEAKKLVEGAKEKIYKALDTRREEYEILFTSGGTEANNLALFGASYAKKRKNPKIIVSNSEHPCILEPCKRLEAQGFTVVRLGTRGGVLDEEQFWAEMDESVFLVSLMSVNNETGALYPVSRFFEMARAKNPLVFCHTDAVQAFLKVPLSVRTLGADMLTLSGHKIGAPKGCGALIVKKTFLKKKALEPRMIGGRQQSDLRSGTENTIGIAGFGGAVEENASLLDAHRKKYEELRAYLETKLPEEVKINRPAVSVSHILSITLPHIKSETALNFLSSRGICVSNGSACASNGKHKSYVLSAFGLNDKEVDSTLRVSFSHDNTIADIDALCAALADALSVLVRFK